MYDLHIHSCLSDGILDIQEAINNSFSDMKIISFCDHEYIFNPSRYTVKSNGLRLVSGVELCCNIHGVAIEILGYNFWPDNKNLVDLVNEIRNKRNCLIKDILKSEKMDVEEELPFNIFRKDIRKYFVNKYGDYNIGWNKYNKEYVKICHEVSATEVINSIVTAGGIPVLAHPMESFKNMEAVKVEKLILDLDIGAVEVVTPKHTEEEIRFMRRIAKKYKLNASVGSDTHGQYSGNRNIYDIELNDDMFEWIRDM